MQTSTEKPFPNIIGDKELESHSGKSFEDLNPATGEVIGRFQKSEEGDVDQAVEAAQKAFGLWQSFTFRERAAVFMRMAQLMRENYDDLSRTLTMEQGKTLRESNKEIDDAIKISEFFSGGVGLSEGEFVESDKRRYVAYTMRQPLGVVAVVTPWNYPVSIPMWKMVPALMAGNTAVFKPASYTPMVGFKLVSILRQAGMPPGVVNYVTGGGATVGDRLVKHPGVRGVSFTGSTLVGDGIHRLAVENHTKVQLEMGGKNACVVLDDANLDLFMGDLLSAAFGVTGQKCTATSRLIATEGISEEVLERVLRLVEGIKVGNGLMDGVTIGPLVSRDQLETVLSYIEIGKREGAKLVAGGKQLKDQNHVRGYFIEPTVFADVSPDMRIAQEEIFGPVLSFIVVKNFDEALDTVNNSRFGLSSSIYTQSLAKAMEFVQRVETGVTHVNISTNFIEPQLPFGGMKSSGFGQKEQGRQAFDFFTEAKTVYIRPG